jgi:hypothetical protein
MSDVFRTAPGPIANPATDSGPEAVRAQLAQVAGLSRAEWTLCLRRAAVLDADPFDLAIGDGVITEARFLAGLAALTGAKVDDKPPRPAEPIRAEEALALRTYRAGNSLVRVVHPNGELAIALVRQQREGRLPQLILTGRQGFVSALIRADANRIAESALRTLPARHSARPAEAPEQAAGTKRRLARIAAGMAILALLLMIALAFPLHALVIPPLLLAPVFIVAGIAALTATLESLMPPRLPPPVESHRLPRYTILVPLYDEANIAEALIGRLDALIYPRDRLEVLLLVEADDHKTYRALKTARLPPCFTIFPVPDGRPRTKPRALNAALPFARGDLIVVYDAEDAPEPDQLLRAAALFASAHPNIACLQARLAITNAHDGFLTRRFAIDYAALFDCVKAGSARAGWSVPLGGSSNHFKTGILRQVGAWDAWNVTEDADLGLRLARFGWLVEDLRSTTWEEAPNTVTGWLGQRRRWLKGWLQTLAVQWRDPAGLVEGLGVFRSLVIAATGLAVLAGALFAPLFAIAVAIRLADPLPLGAGPPLLLVADAMLVLTLGIAVLVEAIPPLVALTRRRALGLAPWILFVPVTHLMVTIAAWQALWELARRPYHWQKTAHGRARRTGGLGPLTKQG